MYAAEDPGGYYPQLSNHKGQLIFLSEKNYDLPISSEQNMDFLICPHDLEKKTYSQQILDPGGQVIHKAVIPASYCYLGYVITNDKEMRAFAEAYKKRIAQGLPFDTDLDVAPGMGTGGSDKIFRFRRDMSEIFKQLGWDEKKQYTIPLVWERCVLPPNQNKPQQRHGVSTRLTMFVGFYAGGLEAIRYGEGKWPLTEETLRLFWELENL